MTSINFIPDSFFRAQARRQVMLRTGTLLAGVPVVMALWLTLSPEQRLEQLDAQLAALDSQLAAVSAAEQPDAVDVSEQMALCRELEAPVPCASILAVISGCMPSSVGLTTFSLAGPPDQAASANPRRRAGGEPAGPPPGRALSLVLTGLAPDSVAIARFLGRLDEHLLFDHVELDYSRPVEDGQLPACEFQITAEIPCDRNYTLILESEVTGAD